ncbi:MAG TPA: ABC transporter permease [Candidatus Limnocylindria bacterium]|nr:ABC transporter permease [Candidatus Limnocylindria bacterium]
MSRPAPPLRAAAALAALELRLTARRGENILATIVIPVAVLLFFAGTSTLPDTGVRQVDVLLPGSIALGIIASSLVNLGIATGYDRQYGVLKRLGGAPLPRWGLVAAKIAAVLVLELVQVIALVTVANLAFGWTPGPGWSPLLAIGAVLLGTLAFAGLGLLLAGTMRAEANLALANALFLTFMLIGGIILPVDHLPAFLQPIAAILPSTALADLLRISLASGAATVASANPLSPIATLAGWTVIGVGLATRRFRWE